MARGFTEQEKQKIKTNLINECEKSWTKFGYKKTNIDEICSNAGISKGAFYLFFKSKEAIFVETLCMVQDHLYTIVDEILNDAPNKQGFAKALKVIYSEYNKRSFIADLQSPDFLAFLNKLTPEQIEAIEKNSRHGGELMLDKPYLHFKIDKKEAAAILTTLLSIVSIKEKLSYDHYKVFDFCVDHLVDQILE